MKVILSRKGFDSSAGGMMSPIMENDDLLSLPIPIGGENKTYGEVFYGKRSLRDLLVELNPRFNFCDCHLDPDIEESRHACKLRGWRPAFGQCGAAATTLKRLDVGEGDVFLFLGIFTESQGSTVGYSMFVRDRIVTRILICMLFGGILKSVRC